MLATLKWFATIATSYGNIVAAGAQVPSPERNFVREEVFYVSAKDDATIQTLALDRKGVTYQYYDAFGHNTQEVKVRHSPSQNDFINFKVLDKYKREVKSYLPYSASGSGRFRSSPVEEQRLFYSGTRAVASDSEPFHIIHFDDCPENSIQRTFAPGWQWHTDPESKPAANTTTSNRAGEVLNLYVSSDGTLGYSPAFYYAPNSLGVVERSDESGVVHKTYTDFKNYELLSRRGSGNVWYDTYNVYDVSGYLRIILPPEATARLNEYHSSSAKQVFMDKWCFQYSYDEFGRCIAKKNPGAGWLYFLYDQWDRVVAVQTANQRKENEWSYTKYDSHNRPIIRGVISGKREDLQKAIAGAPRFESRAGNAIGYTNRAFPPHSESNITAIAYYDCYNFLRYPGWDSEKLDYTPRADNGLVNLVGIFVPADGSIVFQPVVRGYATGSKIKVLGQNKWLNSVSYYDKKYRLVQTISENIRGTADVMSVEYNNYTGKPIKKRTHHPGPAPLSVMEEYEYDPSQRLTHTWHRINGGQRVLMLQNKYNELGQLVEKNTHSADGGKTYLQSIDYRYNIQGWLTHINNSSLINDNTTNDDSNDLFGMEYTFTEPVSVNAGAFVGLKRFDGNPSAIKWKRSVDGENGPSNCYAFNYDPLGRFSSAYYTTLKNKAWTGTPALYNESVSRFDRNGNIGTGSTVTLTRSGMVDGVGREIDQLEFRYDGNQLRNTIDHSHQQKGFTDKSGVGSALDEYRYDLNGNMVEDFNKSVSKIVYNHLNLPVEIELTRADVSPNRTDRILFTYDAEGSKLRRDVYIGNTRVLRTEYVGSIQYDNDQLSFFNTAEGRVVHNAAGFEYEYFFRDHQNNVRMVYGLGKETHTFKATMEPRYDTKEQIDYGFRNIRATRSLGNNITYKNDVLEEPSYSARVNGASRAGMPANPVGPCKTLPVSAGDAIFVEVFARYNNVKTASSLITAPLLAASLVSAIPISSAENPVLWNAIQPQAVAASASISSTSAVPKAYVAALYFNGEFEFKKAVVKAISEHAYKSFERLTISITPAETGYVYVYVANESSGSDSPDVFFDDLHIAHQRNVLAPRVFQATDFYPYGLSFNEVNAEKLHVMNTTGEKAYDLAARNRYLFQGQELLKDLGLNWYHFKYRMHDPALGRFVSIDPLAEEFPYNSPYAFSENKLMNGIELEGKELDKLFETMKYVSPIALRPNLSLTSHDTRIGLDISFGLPKILPFSYRMSYGVSANLHNIIEGRPFAETRVGKETSYLFGNFSLQSMEYRGGAISQRTGMVTLGNPFINVKYENDWFKDSWMSFLDPGGFHPKTFGDGGDRFRTAAVQFNYGVFRTGIKLATGDPGLNFSARETKLIGGRNGTYVLSNGNNPDAYRVGLLYQGLGPAVIGFNNEFIRHHLQNVLVHDGVIGSPWFEVMPTTNQLYFGFDSGSNSQW